MAEGTLEAVLRRDRLVVAGALTALTVLSWSYILWLGRAMATATPSMPGMPDMPDMPGMAMATPAFHAWTASDFAVTFVMWAVMMVGMMTPSAAPMILIHARVARQAASQGKPLAATGWFASGYLLSWTVFSFAATFVQGLLDRAALLTPMLAVASHRVGGLVLLAAGIYQWTPVKQACLRHCRSPLEFLQLHGGFRKTAAGALGLGFQHGLYCIGCCWALMALLFAGGVMNIVWIAGIAIFVLIEKIAPAGRAIARVAGIAFGAGGLWLLFRG